MKMMKCFHERVNLVPIKGRALMLLEYERNEWLSIEMCSPVFFEL